MIQENHGVRGVSGAHTAGQPTPQECRSLSFLVPLFHIAALRFNLVSLHKQVCMFACMHFKLRVVLSMLSDKWRSYFSDKVGIPEFNLLQLNSMSQINHHEDHRQPPKGLTLHEKKKRSYEDGSFNKVPTIQVQGPAFVPQNLHRRVRNRGPLLEPVPERQR